ncbi:MAG: hypothetical protein U1E86_28900 [Burkholderiaceae bacterium]
MDSMTINSGGEKIFVEEVEQALKRHPAVQDAIVVDARARAGAARSRQRAAARRHDGLSDELADACREHLARQGAEALRRARPASSAARGRQGRLRLGARAGHGRRRVNARSARPSEAERGKWAPSSFA